MLPAMGNDAEQHRAMNRTEWALLLLLALLWGGSFFFGKVALAAVPPLTLVVLRTGLAALALIAVLAATGRKLPSSLAAWRGFLVMGLLNNAIPFALINWGQTRIDSGLAAILNATTPLFTVILAHLVTSDEKLTRNRVAGVVLGFAGVVVMIGPAALGGAELGKLAVLAAAASYACAGLYGRRLGKLAPVTAACGMLVAATLIMLPLALVLDRPALPAGAVIWEAVGALALFSTALAYIVYFRILATAGATNLLLVTFLIPVSALLLGGIVLGERPDATAFAGMALIFLGLVAVDGRLVVRTLSRLLSAWRSHACRDSGDQGSPRERERAG
jgi:drug/metabolite transporter (DMT)-like permease